MTIAADRKLVHKVLAADERAFDSFFRQYFPRLYRFALVRAHGDEDLAEEATQRALCKAIDHLGSYRGEAPLFSWLCTFCRREVYALGRDRIRQAKAVREEDPSVRIALEALRDPAHADPQQVASRCEVRKIVHATLDALPTLYGNVLEWKYFHGLSVKEIAKRIERGPKATESLLTRSRNAFRDSIQAFAGDLHAEDTLPSPSQPGPLL